MNTLKKREYIIKDVAIGKNKLFIELYPKKIIEVPFNYTPKLKKATKEELENYKIIGGGIGIHFKDLDEDISVDGLIRDFIKKYKKITISLPNELVEKIDEIAINRHINRSTLIQEALKNLKDING